MTTDKNYDFHDYYVQTWLMGEPNPVPAISAPLGAISYSTPETREMVWPGMDTITEHVLIRFYVPFQYRASEDGTISPGLVRLEAMVERALLLLRTDPVFGCLVVTSAIVSVDRSVSTSAETFRVAEIIIRLTRRALWGQE